jgi:hypothetical protein
VQLASFTVPIALLLIAATGVVHAVHCCSYYEAPDERRIGSEPSVTRHQLAAVRAELASRNVTVVELVMTDVDLTKLEGAPQAVSEPPPGISAAMMNSFATFFLETFTAEQNADPEAVRTHLRDWWVQMVVGMHQSGIEYGLLPIVVRAGAPWVVGVFDRGVDHQALAQRRGLTVVRDFGGGVVLFREGR